MSYCYTDDDGTKYWYDGSPNDPVRKHYRDCSEGHAIEYPDGTKLWYRNDRLHKEDGPAVIEPIQGWQEWYIDGLLHREDGPAVFYELDGEPVEEWWYRGNRIPVKSLKEFQSYIRNKALW